MSNEQLAEGERVLLASSMPAPYGGKEGTIVKLSETSARVAVDGIIHQVLVPLSVLEPVDVIE
jgi:hypothetical protein